MTIRFEVPSAYPRSLAERKRLVWLLEAKLALAKRSAPKGRPLGMGWVWYQDHYPGIDPWSAGHVIHKLVGGFLGDGAYSLGQRFVVRPGPPTAHFTVEA